MSVIDSRQVLPPWAKTYDISGEKTVWILPVYGPGEDPWNESELLASANETLASFAYFSDGRLTVTAKRVLDPVFYTPVRGSDCNGMANVVSPAKRDLKRALAERPDVHVVALTRVRDCPYGGMGETPGQFVTLTFAPETAVIPADTLLHELGHNFGLPHAGGYVSGGLLSSTSRAGNISGAPDQYGDQTNIMGSGPVSSGFGVASLAALGWGDGVFNVPVVDGVDATVTLPRLDLDAPDAVLLTDPVSDVRYTLTYLHDADNVGLGGVPLRTGVFLHQVAPDKGLGEAYGASSLSTWLPWSFVSFGGRRGVRWVSPTGGLSVDVGPDTGEHVEVRVRVSASGGLVDDAGPAWMANPRLQRTSPTSAKLHLPTAWDQSGVAEYTVAINGKPLRTAVSPPAPVGWVTLRVNLQKRNNVIAVAVSDRKGNTTRWVKRMRATA